jgi:glyoxylase I family protein
MVKGIEHTAITSPDPQRLARWYVENLGLAIHFQTPDGKALFLRAPDGTMIEVFESNDAPRAAVDLRAPGIRHLALTVAEFEPAYRDLQAKGVSFLAEPQKNGGNTVVFFTDCDGNILHLIHRERPL